MKDKLLETISSIKKALEELSEDSIFKQGSTGGLNKSTFRILLLCTNQKNRKLPAELIV